MISRRFVILGSAGLVTSAATAAAAMPAHWRQTLWQKLSDPHPQAPSLAEASLRFETPWAEKLVKAGLSQIGQTLIYDPAYVRLSYPGGDVPLQRGVCTDVVIRAYRKGLGIDLQKLVHEDMAANFSAYPKGWGLKRPDRNIDHRRVPNLQTFFTRHQAKLGISDRPEDYRPGDLVTMKLPGNLPHIGIVTAHSSDDQARPLLVHNIGAGARLEDVLFAYPVTGHYRYSGAA